MTAPWERQTGASGESIERAAGGNDRVREPGGGGGEGEGVYILTTSVRDGLRLRYRTVIWTVLQASGPVVQRGEPLIDSSHALV